MVCFLDVFSREPLETKGIVGLERPLWFSSAAAFFRLLILNSFHRNFVGDSDSIVVNSVTHCSTGDVISLIIIG